MKPYRPIFGAILVVLALAGCSGEKSANAGNTAAATDSSTDLPAVSGATYTVNLSLPFKEGQKFHYVADVTHKGYAKKTTTSTNTSGVPATQQEEQNTEFTAHLEGEGEVRAVFPNGSIRILLITVNTFTASANGEAISGLPPAGAKIVGEREDSSTVVRVDGQLPSDDLSPVLVDMFVFNDAKYTDQERFGPKVPVAVGATWPVNADAIKDGIKPEDIESIAAVNGTMKLDGIQGTGDNQVALVSGNCIVEGAKNSSPLDTVDANTMNMQMSGSFPATTGRGVLKETMRITTDFSGQQTTQDGTVHRLSYTLERDVTIAITFP